MCLMRLLLVKNIMIKNTSEEINTPCHDNHSITQGMAYGMLAGVEPVVGIYTGIANLKVIFFG